MILAEDNRRENPARLYLPDVTGMTPLAAALAYAEAGWYVLPTDPDDIKNPGSIVGGRWHELSSRNPNQIRHWWTENPKYGIALHCGRSGAIVFDLDVDSLKAVRDDIADALSNAGAIQGTRRDGDRGHYLYLMPEDRQFGNGAGAFMTWGEVRGKNGVIIVAPTPHPDAETKDGDYNQRRTGAVGPLPDVLRECLTEAGESAEPLTNAELDTFLDTYEGGGCGRENCPHTVTGPVKRFDAAVADGASRHDTMTAVLVWALSEAMAGCYAAREVYNTLYATYAEKFDADTERERVDGLGDEYLRMAAWAAAQADPERAHRNDELPTDAEMEAFWGARPELERLRTFARARRVGPWAVFGTALARLLTTIPPSVVLPPTTGSFASLNFFVALVAPSGFGKNAAEKVAADALETATYVFVTTPGSGEGIPKLYAYKRKPRGQDWEQVNVRNAAMFSVPEVDTFAALTARGGSTLGPELRKAWMGEQLGFWWSDAEKRVTIMEHRYRMTMVVGVQPGRGGVLLQDADGGTPQRFIWLPTTDPKAPDEPPEEPEPWQLREWPKPQPATYDTDDEDGTKLKFGPAVHEMKLDVPQDKSEFHVLELPVCAVEAIQQKQLEKLREEVPEDEALDAHAMLAQLKVATALMWMNGRTDMVDEEDWNLADVVMRVSNATRANVAAALRTKASVENVRRGRAEGERAVASESVRRQAAVLRVAENMMRHIEVEGGEIARIMLRNKKIARRDRDEYFDDAEALLLVQGRIEKVETEYNAQPGHVLRVVVPNVS
jgi:hypothetical protein